MSGLTAIVAGATGLVGGECLRQLLACPRYERVIVVTRRELGAAARHDKLREVVVEFDRLGEAKTRLRGDHVFCALGTTIRKAGSQAKFRAVDYEYPLRLARLGLHSEVVTNAFSKSTPSAAIPATRTRRGSCSRSSTRRRRGRTSWRRRSG